MRQEVAEASGATGTNSAAPTRHLTEEMDVDAEEGGGIKEEDGKEKEKEKDGGQLGTCPNTTSAACKTVSLNRCHESRHLGASCVEQ